MKQMNDSLDALSSSAHRTSPWDTQAGVTGMFLILGAGVWEEADQEAISKEMLIEATHKLGSLLSRMCCPRR